MMPDEKDDSVIDLNTRKAPSEISGIVDLSHKITKLRCFKDVHKMVVNGMLPRKIAVAIKDDYGECEGDPLDRVTRMVRDYRDRVIVEDLGIEKIEAKDSEDPNELIVNALSFYIRNQTSRIQMESDTERKLGKLFSTTHKEVNAAVQAALALGKRIDKTGVDRPTVKDSDSHGRLPIGRIMGDPGKLRKVMKAFEAIVEDPDLLAEIGNENLGEIAISDAVEDKKPDGNAGIKKDKAPPKKKKPSKSKRKKPK